MIIVTGGAGFIGSNIVGALTERGRDRVVVCDTLGVDDKWRNIAKHNIADLIAPPRLLDYLNGLARSAWLFSRPVEAIIHMGAISSTTETDADRIFETNVRLSRFQIRHSVPHPFESVRRFVLRTWVHPC